VKFWEGGRGVEGRPTTVFYDRQQKGKNQHRHLKIRREDGWMNREERGEGKPLPEKKN